MTRTTENPKKTKLSHCDQNDLNDNISSNLTNTNTINIFKTNTIVIDPSLTTVNIQTCKCFEAIVTPHISPGPF